MGALSGQVSAELHNRSKLPPHSSPIRLIRIVPVSRRTRKLSYGFLHSSRMVAMPNVDLSALWDEHTKHEFATRDTEATLATMVEDAYVNHIPVMTGGNGKAALRDFYSRHFIPSMPPDTVLTLYFTHSG